MKSNADLLPAVLDFCRQNGLLPAGGHIVVGLSGGPDSLALLDLLHRMAPRHGLTVVAAHLNHGLRGEASDADEASVRRFCDAYGIPLHISRHDIRAEADVRCQGIEETGRRVRYAFFESIARGEYAAVLAERERSAGRAARRFSPEERHVLYREPDGALPVPDQPDHGLPAAAEAAGALGNRPLSTDPSPEQSALLQAGIRIAVGHHRNDQAETVLLNLGRGSGIDGLAGMRPQNGLVIRPLLDMPRAGIDAYIRWRGLEPCLDATNLDMEATRNRLRHRVLPALSEAFGFDAVTPLARAARLLRQDADCLQQQAEAALEKLRAGSVDSTEPGRAGQPARAGRPLPGQKLPGQIADLPIRNAAALHPAILGRVLRLWYRESFGETRDLSESQVAGLVGLCASGRSGRRSSLPHGRQAVRSFDWLVLLAPPSDAPAALPDDEKANLPAPDSSGLQKIYETDGMPGHIRATGSREAVGNGLAGSSDVPDAIDLQKINAAVDSPPGGVGNSAASPCEIGVCGPESPAAAGASPGAEDAPEACPIVIPGVTGIPGGGRFVTQFIVDQAQIVYNDRTWCFQASTLAGAVARHRRPHDHIQVEGAAHGKLLKKFLCERQVPADLRDRLPLIARDAMILWIPGVAASERLPAGSGPKDIPPGQWIVVRYIRPEAAADGELP